MGAGGREAQRGLAQDENGPKKGTDWQEKLTEMKARHREERRAFMAREIASWAAKEDATTSRLL